MMTVEEMAKRYKETGSLITADQLVNAYIYEEPSRLYLDYLDYKSKAKTVSGAYNIVQELANTSDEDWDQLVIDQMEHNKNYDRKLDNMLRWIADRIVWEMERE